MRRPVLLCALLALAAPAAAREAVYHPDDEAFRRDALALEVDAPFEPMPSRGATDIALEDGAKLDNQLMILGIYCRAWKVENALSTMVERALGAADRDGAIAASAPAGAAVPTIIFRATGSRSTMRCVEQKELKTRCLTTTKIDGEARVGDGPPVPVSVEAKHQQVVGVCGGLSRGTAVSGRAAAIRLANRLGELAAAR